MNKQQTEKWHIEQIDDCVPDGHGSEKWIQYPMIVGPDGKAYSMTEIVNYLNRVSQDE